MRALLHTLLALNLSLTPALPQFRCDVVASVAAENSNGSLSLGLWQFPYALHLIPANCAFDNLVRWIGTLVHV